MTNHHHIFTNLPVCTTASLIFSRQKYIPVGSPTILTSVSKSDNATSRTVRPNASVSVKRRAWPGSRAGSRPQSIGCRIGIHVRLWERGKRVGTANTDFYFFADRVRSVLVANNQADGINTRFGESMYRVLFCTAVAAAGGSVAKIPVPLIWFIPGDIGELQSQCLCAVAEVVAVFGMRQVVESEDVTRRVVEGAEAVVRIIETSSEGRSRQVDGLLPKNTICTYSVRVVNDMHRSGT